MEQGPQNPNPYPQYVRDKAEGGAATELPEHTHTSTDEAGTLPAYAMTGANIVASADAVLALRIFGG